MGKSIKEEIMRLLSRSLVTHVVETHYKKILESHAVDIGLVPASIAEATMVVFPGYRMHNRTPHFRDLRAWLKMKHFNVLTADLPGHGLSVTNEVGRGQIKSFRAFMYLARAMVFKALSLTPSSASPRKSIPIYCLGYSLGGLAWLRLLQRKPYLQDYIAGVILIAPPLEVDQNADPRILRYKRIIAPALPFFARIYPSFHVARPDFVVPDGLHYNGPLTLRTAHTIRTEGMRARQEMHKIKVPVLVIVGEGDVVAHAEAVKKYFPMITSSDKTLLVYPGVDHDILEKADARLRRDIAEWMKARIPTALRPMLKEEDVAYMLAELFLVIPHAVIRITRILRKLVIRLWQRIFSS